METDDEPKSELGHGPVVPAEAPKVKPLKLNFEVGTVYRYRHSYFLAMAFDVLLSLANGKPKAIRPIKPQVYEIVRHMTITDICKAWNITDQVFDAVVAVLMEKMLAGPVRTCVRGSRRGRDKEAEGMAIRLVRIRWDHRTGNV